jgi:hypothetical protein
VCLPANHCKTALCSALPSPILILPLEPLRAAQRAPPACPPRQPPAMLGQVQGPSTINRKGREKNTAPTQLTRRSAALWESQRGGRASCSISRDTRGRLSARKPSSARLYFRNSSAPAPRRRSAESKLYVFCFNCSLCGMYDTLAHCAIVRQETEGERALPLPQTQTRGDREKC